MPPFALRPALRPLKIRDFDEELLVEELEEHADWVDEDDLDDDLDWTEHHGTPVRIPSGLPEEVGYAQWSKAAEKRIPPKPVYSEVKVPTAREVREYIEEITTNDTETVTLLKSISGSISKLINLHSLAKEVLEEETIDDVFSLHLMEAEVKKMVGVISTWEKKNKVQLLPAE